MRSYHIGKKSTYRTACSLICFDRFTMFLFEHMNLFHFKIAYLLSSLFNCQFLYMNRQRWILALGNRHCLVCSAEQSNLEFIYSFVAQLNFERVSIWHFHFSMHLIHMHDNIVPRKNRIRNNSIRIGHWMRKPSLVWHYI